MNIKMIVTDLDGTLLRTDKTISERTKATLSQCKESGVKMVYATARGGSAERILPAGIFDGKVIRGGAIAKIGDEIVYSRLIPHQIIRPILIVCDKRGLRITSETADIKYANYGDNISDFSQYDIDAEMVYFEGLTPDDEVFIKSQLPESLYFMAMSDTSIDANGGSFGMIIHKEATKTKAVSELARLWNITLSEIIAFGDDVNDTELLRNCGISVAVANAIDEVKAAADYIGDTNDNDGVAKWIEERILK